MDDCADRLPALLTAALPREAVHRPLVRCPVHPREVLRGVRGRMDGVLREVDYEPLPSKGEPRWETVACFARLTMVHRGMLKKGSPRGTWEITEKGRALVDRKPTGPLNPPR